MKKEKKLTVIMPPMPNFLKVEGSRVDISVTHLGEDEANEFAELMKRTFIEHWKRKSGKYSK